jgi:hypothetical protein
LPRRSARASTKTRSSVRFTGTIGEARGGGRWVVCPFDAKERFGEARPAVAGTVNGVPFRSRLAIYGGVTYFGLTKELRKAAGVEDGDTVEVELDRDEAPREVDVLPALAAALAAAPDAKAAFDGLAFSHRKEYAVWIASAKREETREARVEKAVAMLRAGTKHP